MPEILGIVNITADSFSDGGRYLDPAAAIRHAQDLASSGATAVDLGPASSHPDAATVSAEQEIARLRPVVEALHARGVQVSVDSWRPETQRWAAAAGVAFLNDIHGFPDAETRAALANSDVRLIAMFSVQSSGNATRTHTAPGHIVPRIESFFDERLAELEQAGVRRDRVIVDPGMGFFLGNAPAPSVEVIAALPRLRQRYGLPVLVSVSRKSFLQVISGAQVGEVGAATLAAEILCAQGGADWIRTHDVRALCNAMAVVAAVEAVR